MLALEPTAQLATSVTVNPGVPENLKPATGRLDVTEHFVSQAVIFDDVDSGVFHVIFESDVLAHLEHLLGTKEFAKHRARDFFRVDPLAATKFQVRLRLRIVYPSTPGQGDRLKGAGLPLVVLMHGQHPAARPNHKGYTYLQEELALHGIASVSVETYYGNVFGAYVLCEMRAGLALHALDYLWDQDADTTSRFYGGRLDFGNVGLMGHSRGGDAVVRAAILNAQRTGLLAHPETKPRYGIKAVCSLAPTDFSGTAATGQFVLTAAEAPFYAVVYGGLDGDVCGGKATDFTGTGFRHYDRAKTQKAMVFLEACNHNRFNTVWAADGDEAAMLPSDRSTRLASLSDHQALTKEYIGGLFRWRLLGQADPASLFDGTTVNSVGAGASLQWSFGNVTELDAMEVSRTVPHGTVQAISSNAVAAGHTNHQTGVLDLDATTGTPVDTYELVLPPALQDWSGFDQFAFRVCADADISGAYRDVDQEPKLAASALPDFTLVFSDDTGTQAVTAGTLRTAERPRRPVSHFILDASSATGMKNCTAIHLETLVIDLKGLTGVDRAKMRGVKVVVPSGYLWHQFFDSFQLVKR